MFISFKEKVSNLTKGNFFLKNCEKCDTDKHINQSDMIMYIIMYIIGISRDISINSRRCDLGACPLSLSYTGIH